jgi:hypothetical protein
MIEPFEYLRHLFRSIWVTCGGTGVSSIAPAIVSLIGVCLGAMIGVAGIWLRERREVARSATEWFQRTYTHGAVISILSYAELLQSRLGGYAIAADMGTRRAVPHRSISRLALLLNVPGLREAFVRLDCFIHERLQHSGKPDGEVGRNLVQKLVVLMTDLHATMAGVRVSDSFEVGLLGRSARLKSHADSLREWASSVSKAFE